MAHAQDYSGIEASIQQISQCSNLPPLPRSLSSVQLLPPLSPLPLESEQTTANVPKTAPNQPVPPQRPHRRARLDAQLSLLRKEMAGLRQLDLALLAQLWALQAAIGDIKSVMSNSQSLSQSQVLSDGEEEDEDL